MRQVRTAIELRQGVTVDLLFTPRLYAFKGREGVDFSADLSESGQVFGLYADILYCAALNLWTLQGNDEEAFPHRRADFHEFSAADPKAFGKAIDFALKALTDKGLRERMPEKPNAPETGKDVKKKRTSGWITRLWKRFSSGGAD